MSLTATLTAALAGTFKKTVDFNDVDAVHNFGLTLATAFTNGTGANQANKIFVDERTLADGASESLDLAGSLTDVYGATLTFSAIKAILVQNESADASLIIDPTIANGWQGFPAADTLTVPPGGVLLLTNPNAAGWAVTAGTADLLSFAHNGTGTSTLTYKVALIGI